MGQIFISYSRKDSLAVNAFVYEMRNSGYDLWLDVSGPASGIPFSTKWFDVIEEAIYYSNGAFIFCSENWERSEPCQKEWELIQKTGMPFMKIDPAQMEQDPEPLLMKARMFCPETIKESNQRRCRIFSSAYAIKNGMEPYDLIERPNGIKQAFYYLTETFMMYFDRKDLEELDPDFYPYIERYTSFAFRHSIRRMLALALGIVMAVILVITAHPVNEAILSGKTEQRNAVDANETISVMQSLMYRDPVAAVSKFSEMNMFAFASPSFPSLLASAVKLQGVDLPCMVMFGDGETLTGKETCGSSGRFTVLDSGEVGMLRLRDSEEGTEIGFTTPGPVTAWAWNHDGTLLAYSCGRDVFVCDPRSGVMDPLRLSASIYPVTEIGFYVISGEEKILAKMDSAVVVWDIPVALRAFPRTEILSGTLLERDTAALYVSDGKLVLNRDNHEEVLPVSVPEGAELRFVTAGEKKRAAVIYSSEGHWKALVINTETGRTVNEFELPCMVSHAVFSESEDILWLAGSDIPVLSADIGSGELITASDSGGALFVIPYGEKVCAVSEDMIFTLYDEGCRPVGKPVPTGGAFSGKAEGVSLPEAGRIYTTCLWPGEKTEIRRVDLGEETEETGAMDTGQKDAACTAVALSADHVYLAYGYADGTVRVFLADEPYMLYEDRPIAEPVTDIRFRSDSDDLIILGASGTVYRAYTAVTGFQADYISSGDNREMLTNRLVDKCRQYYKGILNENGERVYPDIG